MVQDSFTDSFRFDPRSHAGSFLTGIPPSNAMTSTNLHVHLAGKYLDRNSKSLAQECGLKDFHHFVELLLHEGLE